MSREVWQQRLLESVFIFYPDDLKGAFSNVAAEGRKKWSDVAEVLRPFFALPDQLVETHHKVMIEMYKSGLYDKTVFEQFGLGKVAQIGLFEFIPTSDEEIAAYVMAASQAEEMLASFADDEIASGYRKLEEDLKRRENLVRERNGPARDKFAFFNELQCDARYHYWRQMAVWTFDECIALSLGKEPIRVNSETLQIKQRPRFHSPFREQFRFRMAILKRAQLAELIQEPTPPAKFIDWACKLQWEMPEEFAAMSSKGNRSQRQAAHDSTTAALDGVENARLEPSPNTIYRMLLGMAITRFEHRTDRNSSATAMIEEELRHLQELDDTGSNTLGKIEVKNDAIRKALEAAAAHLGANWSEIIRWKGVRRPKSEI